MNITDSSGKQKVWNFLLARILCHGIATNVPKKHMEVVDLYVIDTCDVFASECCLHIERVLWVGLSHPPHPPKPVREPVPG